MSKEELIAQEQTIRESVKRAYIDRTGKASPIYDGVVDPALYLSASARILWILKEPWDEADSSGGGWSLAQDLLNKQPMLAATGPTFQPIIYVTYGIFNQIWSWDDMPYIRDKPEMALLLRSIAFINVKKLPGLTRSNNDEIFAMYQASQEIILHQINTYQPDYIFGCRPHMSMIMADLGASPGQISTHKSVHYTKIENSLFLNVYHPAQTTITRDRYIGDILEVIAQQTA